MGPPDQAAAMSTTANISTEKPDAKPSFHNLPAIVYFPGDELAQEAIRGLQHFLRLTFEDLAKGRRSATVLVTSLERMIVDKAAVLRAPNVRVIALSDWRFRDPRTDGVVYAYLPTKTPPALVERTIDNALDHIHLLASRLDVNERLAGTTKEIHELCAMGAELSAEHDTEKLLDMILTKARALTRADAGSLYLVEEQAAGKLKSVLRLKRTQNAGAPVAFREPTTEIDEKSIAGYVALTGETVNIEDVHDPESEIPCQVDLSFEQPGYRTKSMVAVPMRNLAGKIVGVVELVNCKRRADVKISSDEQVANEVVAFPLRRQEMVASLATLAAVAMENSRSYPTVKNG